MSTLNCPVCTSAMQESTKNGVTIDICPRCRGVWLDRGELEKLMQDIRPEIQRHATRYHEDDDDDRDDHRRHHARDVHSAHHSHPHKKRSKLESFMEIFD
ncbi:MAG: cytoplasmic protein [Proteobacteria bacterium]|nr:cytoplasmic protein [Pseudomonadota bacterium]